MRLQGKVAIVTGAASGFGAEIARLFAAEGAKVLVADIDEEGASRVAGEIGNAATPCRVDVSVAADMERMAKTAIDAFGGFDIVVNNAGISHRNQPMLEVDEATFDRVYAVNVKSIYLAARSCVPELRRRGGGAIINIGSTAGLRPRPGLTWYNGTKGAVHVITKSMAVELAPDKIRVNAVCPVIGETALLETFMGVPDTPENRAKFVATIPMGRMSRPSDIAAATLYLALPESEFLTGVLLPVDGGRSI